MSDLCVVHASEDEAVSSQLVTLLKQHWDVWSDADIAEGEWDKHVRAAIEQSKGVVALLSQEAAQKPIFKDEVRYAQKLNKFIFPFAIETAEMPLGLGSINRTDAFGWHGEENHRGYKALLKKIRQAMGAQGPQRRRALVINGKEIPLPYFVFSVSSFETQISPKDGLQLFTVLKQPRAALISAYDAWTHRKDRRFIKMARDLLLSPCTVFLDSGNYEADRKQDQKTRKNKKGWTHQKYVEVARALSPDIAFGFDNPRPKWARDAAAKKIIAATKSDQKAIRPLSFPICPIVHVPNKREGDQLTLTDAASRIILEVARELDPIMIAIPERELGNGIVERVKVVREIRRRLNTLGKYYPLHLLGTGNPLSMIALSAAGADSYDGLEWCRTSGDWDTRGLFHFQHFDLFVDRYLGRIENLSVRNLIEGKNVPYPAKVACLNIEMFNDWMEDLRAMVHSGQVERWMKTVLPYANKRLYEALSQ